MSDLTRKCILRQSNGEPDVSMEFLDIPSIGDVIEIHTGTSSDMNVNGRVVKVKHIKWLKVEKRLFKAHEPRYSATTVLIVSETTTL